MRSLFLTLCALAVILWLLGLSPFFRVQRYLTSRYQPADDLIGAFRNALRDPSHPNHRDFQRFVFTYSAFLFCVLCAFLIVKLSRFAH